MPESEVQMKKCSVCKTEKPIGEFEADKRMLDGHRNQCAVCRQLDKKNRRADALEARYTGAEKTLRKALLAIVNAPSLPADAPAETQAKDQKEREKAQVRLNAIERGRDKRVKKAREEREKTGTQSWTAQQTVELDKAKEFYGTLLDISDDSEVIGRLLGYAATLTQSKHAAAKLFIEGRAEGLSIARKHRIERQETAKRDREFVEASELESVRTEKQYKKRLPDRPSIAQDMTVDLITTFYGEEGRRRRAAELEHMRLNDFKRYEKLTPEEKEIPAPRMTRVYLVPNEESKKLDVVSHPELRPVAARRATWLFESGEDAKQMLRYNAQLKAYFLPPEPSVHAANTWQAERVEFMWTDPPEGDRQTFFYGKYRSQAEIEDYIEGGGFLQDSQNSRFLLGLAMPFTGVADSIAVAPEDARVNFMQPREEVHSLISQARYYYGERYTGKIVYENRGGKYPVPRPESFSLDVPLFLPPDIPPRY